MLGQLFVAQSSMEDAIAELERDGASTDAARSQLQALGDLQRQIAGAGSAALGSLRGEIASAVAASRALVQQGRTASLAENAEVALAAASARTRATVERVAGDLFDRRVLDPYLQFASAEDEAEYRRREAERQQYIRRELAKGTPEGALNASKATLAQIDDAGAHGADRSPEYSGMRTDTLNAITDRLVQLRSLRALTRTVTRCSDGPRASLPTKPRRGAAANRKEIIMSRQPTLIGHKPTHRLYRVEGEGKSARWTEIGAAWPNKDGQGFLISCHVVPLGGRIVMRTITERPASKKEAA